MPIYEYFCQDCSLKFDYLVRSSQEQIACPYCHKENLRRLISTFAFTSKDARGNITASSASRCSSCTSYNCASCIR